MTTTTKERPILMNSAMVRATLAGAKLQTRRIVKPQPPAGVSLEMLADLRDLDGRAYHNHAMTVGQGDDTRFYRCPFGVPGDRLWVREAWWMHDSPQAFDVHDGNVRDDKGRKRVVGYAHSMDFDSERIAIEYGARKRPSIHMPRWASRLTLEVVSVRVERVQDITLADAVAEGAMPGGENTHDLRYFYDLWGSINGAGAWARNDWVWVVEFKRIGGGA